MRRFLIPALLLGLVLVSLGYAFSRVDRNVYLTVPVERGKILAFVKATGTVEAVLTVDVSSQLSGRVADVNVNFNDVVKTGQVVARLDPEIYAARVSEAKAALNVAKATALLQKAAIQRAQAGLENARTAKKIEEAQRSVQQIKQEELERDYERFLNLSRTASVAQRDMTQARAQRDAGAATMRVLQEQIDLKEQAIKIAQAELAMAEANLVNAQAVVEQKRATLEQTELDQERTEIRSPIDGVIIKRDVNPGQTVAVTLEAKTLFKIAHDLKEMEVRGRIDEADVGKLKIGQRATFSVDAYPDRTFEGHVQQIRKAAEVTQNVVTYTAVISAPNPELLLLPGMTAVLRVQVQETADALKVSNQALRFRLDNRDQNKRPAGSDMASYDIWVVDDRGSPVKIPVQIGASDENDTQITGGALREGQQVIVGVAMPRSRAGFLGIRLGS